MYFTCIIYYNLVWIRRYLHYIYIYIVDMYIIVDISNVNILVTF